MNNRVSFSSLPEQFQKIEELVMPSLIELLRSGNYVNGFWVKNFEIEFAKFSHSKFAIGVNSGTSAIHAALLACGVGIGDEVIAPSHTFIATINAILLTGATPVLVDIDGHGLINSSEIEKSISNKTKAIIPVHLYGNVFEVGDLSEYRSAGIRVIEDASQAHGATHRDGIPIGTKSDVTGYSLYPGKNLGAIGESGVITTHESDLAESCKLIRDWGSTKKYEHDRFGLNYRMDEIQGLFLSHKLANLEDLNNRRMRNAKQYFEGLSEYPIGFLNSLENGSVIHQFVISVEQRTNLQQYLSSQGIDTLIHYPVPVHKQKFYVERFGEQLLSQTEEITTKILSIPVHENLKDSQISYVIDKIGEFYGRH